MRLRRRRLSLVHLLLRENGRAVELIQQQQATIARARQDSVDLQLSYSRIGRDLIAQFLIVLDQPETQDDVRDKLVASLRDFQDEVARLEEQTS